MPCLEFIYNNLELGCIQNIYSEIMYSSYGLEDLLSDFSKRTIQEFNQWFYYSNK